jgi:phosphomannomutase
MASPLMKSVSGIRGIVGGSFDPDLIVRVGSAFAEHVKRGKVVVGRDSRPTGEIIAQCLESVLALAGCDVVDIGIVPTPTVQLAVEELHAAGGVVISASHNPIEWNAFKLIGSSGSFLNQKEINKFFALMEKAGKFMPWDRVGTLNRYEGAQDMHIDRVTGVIDAARVRKASFKVALDSVNGAGSIITPELLKRLGCTTVPVHCTVDGTFPRGAEPVPANLGDLSAAVKSNSCHVGFAQDPDADRLAIVDEQGRPIGEENTIALVAKHLLAKKPGRVVVNLSTTKTVEEIARQFKSPFKRTRVGEINVADEMRRGGARIGGEGNGGVISPEVHLGRDSLAGIVYVLEMMAETGKSVSQLVAELPSFVMIKGKTKISGKSSGKSFAARLKKEFKGDRFSEIDGVRIDFTRHAAFRGGWVHLRPSNTEPIFRIIAEGVDAAQAKKIYSHFEKLLRA